MFLRRRPTYLGHPRRQATLIIRVIESSIQNAMQGSSDARPQSIDVSLSSIACASALLAIALSECSGGKKYAFAAIK
jgi:hypothetical protein